LAPIVRIEIDFALEGPATMTINTKTAPRRTLKFNSLADLSAELDRLESAHRAGTLRHTGNWTPGQIFQHLAIFMRCAADGFPPGKPPLLMKLFMQLVIKRLAVRGDSPPPGIKLPPEAAFLIPKGDVTFDAGLSELRTVISRVTERGEKFTHPSPVFGKLTHEQWAKLHFGHCQHHLGYLQPS